MKWERSKKRMAKVKKNIFMSGLSGSLGPDHYARITRDGRTIISAKPDFSNRQFSEGQLNIQSGMKQAAAYAKVASKENPIYAKKAAGTAKNAYNVALGDWFNPPVIRRLQWHDGMVRVSATDDVMVTGVTITILDEEGLRLEQGEAELVLGVWWDYPATNRGQIQVEARDLAGNVTRQKFDDPSIFTPFLQKAA
jgi:hypothetical protein